MLTKKQAWRRCKARNPRRSGESEHSHIFSSPEWKDVLPEPPLQPQKSESWSHTPRRGIFASSANSISCGEFRRKVNFDDNVRVVLIPSHKDYEGLVPFNTIWWTREDYEDFKSEALKIYKAHGHLRPADEEGAEDESQKPHFVESSESKMDPKYDAFQAPIAGEHIAQTPKQAIELLPLVSEVVSC